MARSAPPAETSNLAQMLERAVALHQRGQLSEAEKLYRNVLRARPKHFEARHLFGILRFQQGRADEALELIAAALQIKPDDPDALYNYGNVLAQLGRYEDAVARYDRALALAPGNAAAHQNRGNALFKLGRYDQALAALDRALALEPNSIEALNSRGTVLKEGRRADEALASYDRAIALRPDLADAHYNRGNLLKELQRYAQSLASYDTARSIDPRHPDAFGIIEPAMAACAWDKSAGLAEALRADLMAGRSSVTPFTLLGYCDDPALHRQCAKNFVNDRMPLRPPRMWDGTREQNERIRIAYLSADYREHATAYLIAELFELHDRSRFEILGVSFGSDDGSAIRGRLVRSLDSFHEVRMQSDREIAALLATLQVDIAVDLKGYTRGSRPDILSGRPVPLQVQWLGYPGTMGADFIDYIIADETVAPFEQAPHYCEKIVQLPGCYQANDGKRAIAERTPSRHEAGLPESGFVFCCFNNSYKIAAPVFDVWMRLLQAVPGGVLWLLHDNTEAEDNLRRAAAARGVEPARLIFASRVALADHLARHRLADLFLDTLPYNAHTTASDALWAGLPLVTCQGQAFAGRVAASLLKAIGLPELITHSLADYEALALRLATDPGELQRLRARLALHRFTRPLFDTERFRRGLEAAYLRMWDFQQRGEPPQSFQVGEAAL